jgi:hypothetical protein
VGNLLVLPPQHLLIIWSSLAGVLGLEPVVVVAVVVIVQQQVNQSPQGQR